MFAKALPHASLLTGQPPTTAPVSEKPPATISGVGLLHSDHFNYKFFTLNNQEIIIRQAVPGDKIYSKTITDEMESSAKARGTGIAKRSPEYIEKKIDDGKAVIAIGRQNFGADVLDEHERLFEAHRGDVRAAAPATGDDAPGRQA